MNWVKIQNNLPSSNKIIQLARVMNCDPCAALGVAVRWLCWLDRHTEDGKTGLTQNEVSEYVCGHTHAMIALCEIGWAEVAEDGTVHAVDFDKYNSPTAKARTLQAARKANQRANKKHNK